MPESNAKSLGKISGPLLKNNLVRNGVKVIDPNAFNISNP